MVQLRILSPQLVANLKRRKNLPRYGLPDFVFQPLRYFMISTLAVIFSVLLIGSGLKVLFSTYPWTVCHMLYLNHASWPPTNLIDFANLSVHGVDGRNVYLKNGNVTLGVWFIDPEKSIPSADGSRQDLFHFSDVDQLEDFRQKHDLSNLPVILYVHGNAGSRAEFCRVRLYANLRRLGFTVVAFDYRGYGDSTGAPWGEQDLVEDGFAVYEMIRKEYPQKEIIIWGHSLGTGVSTHLVQMIEQKNLRVDGLILDSPFSSLEDAMKRHPFLVPLHMVPGFTDSVSTAMKTMQVNLNNSEVVLTLKTPVLILHAEDDKVVPIELGRKLFAVAKQRPAPVTLVTFKGELGYGHRGIYRDPNLPKIVDEFVESCRDYVSSGMRSSADLRQRVISS